MSFWAQKRKTGERICCLLGAQNSQYLFRMLLGARPTQLEELSQRGSTLTCSPSLFSLCKGQIMVPDSAKDPLLPHPLCRGLGGRAEPHPEGQQCRQPTAQAPSASLFSLVSTFLICSRDRHLKYHP